MHKNNATNVCFGVQEVTGNKRVYRRSSQKQPTCWSFGEAGHIQQNCKKQATEGTPLAAANPEQDQGNCQ